MGLISTWTMIRSLSLFHLTAAYLFLTNPRMIVDQNVVFMLGESMRLPHITTMDKPSEASALLAVILAFLGVSDLTAASMEEGIAIQYWLAIVPVRMTFLFAITGYSYLFKQGGLFGSKTALSQSSMGEPLQNSMVFSWGFLELAAWFWIFTSLREERRLLAKRKIEELKAEQDSL
ncbi:hypothetical protein D0869_02500 [Hortaea werneckii]|uniref:Increased loss of mitochondrial DNA protein 1 n=1 Tax=Hortaea werneckii TaxID=91943 RepID=A0A3M6XLB7_HORWE|nr:hypothetical protein KC334_g10946 [Hortaea werneckii]KAI6958514.1 hypothetical protein KC355_g12946 [Hortaea werneckii]KAI7165597.1 hypothetical protein KC324_g12491 [Hortaea werneckii]KAI7564532.1 hypothetical protein KC316_g12609 [Hortaea werneckii]KAI7659212.1 hypothetical protein KC318_g10782 [Hortaea werneckii]